MKRTALAVLMVLTGCSFVCPNTDTQEQRTVVRTQIETTLVAVDREISRISGRVELGGAASRDVPARQVREDTG